MGEEELRGRRALRGERGGAERAAVLAALFRGSASTARFVLALPVSAPGGRGRHRGLPGAATRGDTRVEGPGVSWGLCGDKR